MPVTAKLSRRFYEQLGDELANELVDWFNAVDATYRADLEHLNEINFARFDAKLEQRLAELEARWDRRFVQLEAKWDGRFSELGVTLAKLRSDLVLWMFAFWTGTLLALAAFLFAVLRTRA